MSSIEEYAADFRDRAAKALLCQSCGHAHRGRPCHARVGGVPGFPSTQHQCRCAEFVEQEAA